MLQQKIEMYVSKEESHKDQLASTADNLSKVQNLERETSKANEELQRNLEEVTLQLLEFERAAKVSEENVSQMSKLLQDAQRQEQQYKIDATQKEDTISSVKQEIESSRAKIL